MSGKDEMPSFQCPLCDRDVNRTIHWSGYVGRGTSGNWCHLMLNEQARILGLKRSFLKRREALQLIDRIRCWSEILGMRIYRRKHNFYPGNLTFERVKAAILQQDNLMRREAVRR